MHLSKDVSVGLPHDEVLQEVLDVLMMLVLEVLFVDALVFAVQAAVAQLHHRFRRRALNRK